MTQRYPAYKDSGVEWLGEVPEGWRILNPRRLFAQVRDPAHPDDEQLSATQKSGVIPQRLYMEQEEQKVVLALAGLENFKRAQLGDFVISLRSFQGGIEYSAYDGCVSPAYTVLRPTASLDGGYYRYLLKSDEFILKLQSVTSGIRDGRNVSYEQFAMVPLCVPPVPEQTAIAAFLDRETAKIDALVAEQRRLIDLLREKRQAVISHTVTKGLNPNAPLKPTGIDWLGDVPDGWEVVPLKKVAAIQTGIAKGKDNTGIQTIEVPYLRVANVQDGHIDLTDVATIEIPVESLDRYRLRPGDVLMNEGGDFDKLGRGAIWDGTINPCIHQNHVFAVRPHGTSAEWLNAVTGSDYAQFFFMTRSKQSTNLASISSTNLMELPLVLPPAQEQAEIVAFISDQTAKLDTLTATAETAIALLQERRAALISAAVTGKIDVRDNVTDEVAT